MEQQKFKNQSTNLKVAVAHDWLTGMRGGERVLECVLKLFPQAPIFTLVYQKENVSPLINSHPVKESWLKFFPFGHKKYRHYLPLYPLLTKTIGASGKEFDLLVSTSSAVGKAFIKTCGGKRPFHICYIHTPMRYVWDRFDDYFGVDQWGWFLSTVLLKPMAWWLKKWDVKTSKNVDVFISNSNFVAQRVKQFYGRDSLVLPAPVELKRFFKHEDRLPSPKSAQYYLVVSALVPYKKIDQAIEACAKLSRPLKIVGSGQDQKKLEALATRLGAKVEFLGAVENDDLVKYYQGARALLFPGVEDFGIVPLEAIASGCPVVALKKGGVLDSMTEKTAQFYESPTVDGLLEGILAFENKESSFNLKELREQAEKFDSGHFEQKLKMIIEEHVSKKC